MYETSGTLNKETGKEFLKVSAAPWYKILTKTLIAIIFLLSILSAILWIISSRKEFLIFVAELAGMIFLVFLIYSSNVAKIKILHLDPIKEISDNGEFEFRVFFNDNGANISNLTTSANYEIKYESFYRLEETPSMYVLFTKYAQYVLVFKNCLNEEEINSFKEFIKGKCKNIK